MTGTGPGSEQSLNIQPEPRDPGPRRTHTGGALLATGDPTVTLLPMKPWITTTLELTGIVLFGTGAWYSGIAGGLMATGAGLIATSYILSRR